MHNFIMDWESVISTYSKTHYFWVSWSWKQNKSNKMFITRKTFFTKDFMSEEELSDSFITIIIFIAFKYQIFFIIINNIS